MIMKRERLFRLDDEAITPVVSTILLLTITLIIISSILAWAIPTIMNQEADAKFDSSFNNLEVVATGMEDCIYSGEDSTRTVNFALAAGNTNIRQNLERWTVSYSFIDSSLNLTTYEPASDILSYEFYGREAEPQVVTITTMDDGNITYFETDNGTILMGETFFRNPCHVTIFNGTLSNLSHKLAEIWVFYVDGIEYKQATGQGEYRLRVVNGGIISDLDSTYGYVANNPMVMVEENSLMLYMVQMNATGLTGGGVGNYRATMSVDDIVVREAGEVKHVQIRINTDKYQKAWYNSFFLAKMGFTQAYRETVGNTKELRSVGFPPLGYNDTVQLKLVQAYTSLKLEDG